MSNDHSDIFTEYVKAHPLDETQMHLPILETGRQKKRLHRVPPDMDFCMKAFAPDHILWAQDYPYGLNEANYDTKASLVKTFLEELDLDEETKENIAHRNAEKLFRL